MSTYNYLDNNGLSYLWLKIKERFATQAQLTSTNTNLSSLQQIVAGIVSEGGEPNVIETVQVNGSALPVSNKTVNISVPTNNANLTNGAGYQTASQVNSAIASAVAGITQISFQIVSGSLPSTGEVGTIYLLSDPDSNADIYDEYIYVNGTWEKIGSTDVDLSGYVQATDMQAITESQIDSIIAE